MKHSGRSPLGFYMIGVAALFLAGFLLLVVFGAKTYRNTVETQSRNNQDRALLSYFVTCISSNDSGGGARIEESASGQMLVIPDGKTGYGLRIYCADGEVKENYASLSAPLDPEGDVLIGETDRFSLEEVGDGLLRVTTDAGSILLRIRSEGGDAAS